jgi:phosphotriesterase-related protein
MGGKIRTVTGDIDAPDGAVLIHDHLQIDLTHNKGAATVLNSNDEADIVADLKNARDRFGVALMTELTVPGSGRDVVALKRISEAAGVGVVASTGFYWDPIHSDVIDGTVESLRRTMVREITDGVGDTRIRCGVIKIGTDVGAPPEPAAKLFKAAALASRDTGVAIVTHTSTADQAPWQIDQLELAGADLSRVLISHLHNFGGIDALSPQAKRGVYFGFDQIGFANGPSYEDYAELIVKSVGAGFLSRNMIASDIARRARLSRHGGTSYATIFTHLLPLLRERGLGDAEIRVLTHDNPVRLLTMAA